MKKICQNSGIPIEECTCGFCYPEEARIRGVAVQDLIADMQAKDPITIERNPNIDLLNFVNRVEQNQKYHKIFRLPVFNVDLPYWYKMGEDNRN